MRPPYKGVIELHVLPPEEAERHWAEVVDLFAEVLIGWRMGVARREREKNEPPALKTEERPDPRRSRWYLP